MEKPKLLDQLPKPYRAEAHEPANCIDFGYREILVRDAKGEKSYNIGLANVYGEETITCQGSAGQVTAEWGSRCR